jgi:hypothetical protein
VEGVEGVEGAPQLGEKRQFGTTGGAPEGKRVNKYIGWARDYPHPNPPRSPPGRVSLRDLRTNNLICRCFTRFAIHTTLPRIPPTKLTLYDRTNQSLCKRDDTMHMWKAILRAECEILVKQDCSTNRLSIPPVIDKPNVWRYFQLSHLAFQFSHRNRARIPIINIAVI